MHRDNLAVASSYGCYNRVHERVLYVDIDIHHGDGVEEAFYTTNRVMTCSFHKFGDYFPGTGDVADLGYGGGKNTAINFPLRNGMDDASFEYAFKPVRDPSGGDLLLRIGVQVMAGIFEHYRPTAVLMQCGADSLCGDRLGCFNLTLKGN